MTKSISHWYPRYTGDYAKKTKHLSMVEHGAYTLLLDHYYSTGKQIPANVVQVHRICMAFAQEEQDAVKTVLSEFFTLTEKGYVCKRVEEELEKRRDISEKRRRAAEVRHSNYGANAGANGSTSTSTSTSITTFKEEKEALFFYNELANECCLPKAQKLTSTRKTKIKARLKDCGGLEGWKCALQKIKESGFLMGNNDRAWVADLDFILQESSFIKIMEGKYDDRKPRNTVNHELSEFLDRPRN